MSCASAVAASTPSVRQILSTAREEAPARAGGRSEVDAVGRAGAPSAACTSGIALRSSSRTSAALATSAAAPSRMSRWQPAETALCTGPGTAITQRPRSSAAMRAVMFAPESTAASTTTTPSASPAMIRLRRGKFAGRASTRIGNSLTTAPLAPRSRSKSPRCSWGYGRPRPLPRTAMLRPPTRSAARCAAPSMPLAPPLTIRSPRPASSPASRETMSRP